MQLFCGKKSYSAILSLRNIPSTQHYVLLILRCLPDSPKPNSPKPIRRNQFTEISVRA